MLLEDHSDLSCLHEPPCMWHQREGRELSTTSVEASHVGSVSVRLGIQEVQLSGHEENAQHHSTQGLAQFGLLRPGLGTHPFTQREGLPTL